ncbi:multinuclear nonheme iron-dependent oxidase, partial [Escherichia coli]
IYSEHLSYSHDGGYLYDLLPIPMTQDAVRYVAERILRVQDILGQKLVIENVSTYLMPGAEMTEAEFIVEVIKQADCELLLDVNNVYVNSIN